MTDQEGADIARAELGPTFGAVRLSGIWLVCDSRLAGRPGWPGAGTVNFDTPPRRSIHRAIADARVVLRAKGLS